MGNASAKRRAARGERRSGVVVALVVVLVVAAAVAVTVLGSTTTVDRAVIHDGAGAVREMPLDQDGTLTVTTDKGTNVVEVRAGRVRVVEADCANHDCVDQGWIDRAGQQIVCLPHELWVEVAPAEGGADEGSASSDRPANASGASDGFDTVGS